MLPDQMALPQDYLQTSCEGLHRAGQGQASKVEHVGEHTGISSHDSHTLNSHLS